MSDINSKQQALTQLRATFQQWEDLVTGMSVTQRTTPLEPSYWSTKDVLAHLRAWQQRTRARMEAAQHNHEPEFPKWPAELFSPDGLPSEEEGDVDKVNDWIYVNHRDQPWADVHAGWRDGFLHIIELAEATPENDLLEAGKYPWLWGYALVFILQSTCEHHDEHMEWLLESLHQHKTQ